MATADKMPMLAEGYEKLQNEVRHLKTVERPAIIDAIEEARGHGDISENAEFHAAKERQGHVEAQIAELEDRLSRAMVIDPKTLSGKKVVFGATVHLLDEDDKKVKYQVVGETEADAKAGRISYSSPLGRALIGRTVGDEVEVSAPAGDRYFVIKKVEFV
jgi:transcription elongation factor GreA